jgi:hypothetical protein
VDGNLMYELAMQRIADQQRLAEQRRLAKAAIRARKQARAARRRSAGPSVPALPAVPAIPDFADELLAAAARDTVSAQWSEADRSGCALPGR